MPQSLSRVWLHIVFSTKNRVAFLQAAKFRDQMFKMLSHPVEQFGCVAGRVGGWGDHVHIVCGLSRTLSIAKLVEHLKTETSKWAKKLPHGVSTFAWQEGYGVFSVSQSRLNRVIEYVDSQENHHAKRSDQDEFRELCRKHDVEFNEMYVWD